MAWSLTYSIGPLTVPHDQDGASIVLRGTVPMPWQVPLSVPWRLPCRLRLFSFLFSFAFSSGALENTVMVASFLEKDQWSLVFQVQDTAQFIYK